MKRLALCLLSCFVVAGSGWLAHSVLAQAAPAAAEKSFTVTQSQLDDYVAKKVAAAIAEHDKAGGHAAGATVPDEDVLKPTNWHRAVFNNAEYVVYTGPGQAMFHHWAQRKGAEPPKEGNLGTPAPLK
jgi:hypothetical protein